LTVANTGNLSSVFANSRARMLLSVNPVSERSSNVSVRVPLSLS
jgi:hypothetical protein